MFGIGNAPAAAYALGFMLEHPMRPCLLTMLFALASLAQATPGGLDPNGCHQSQKKGFHCHAPSGKTKSKAQGSAETPAERDKRLRRECKGLPNAGACLGYTR